LVLDGVYNRGDSGTLRFFALPPPEYAAVARVLGQVAKRIARLLARRSIGADADSSEVDPLAESEPQPAAICGASELGSDSRVEGRCRC
jgi:hypothetical protein